MLFWMSVKSLLVTQYFSSNQKRTPTIRGLVYKREIYIARSDWLTNNNRVILNRGLFRYSFQYIFYNCLITAAFVYEP